MCSFLWFSFFLFVLLASDVHVTISPFGILQAKWYYYVLLALVDVEANFLGECLILVEILLGI